MFSGIVSTLTAGAQVRLPFGGEDYLMVDAQPLTAAQRIAWAIESSGKTQTAIAAEIGCSHAALSMWASAHTEADNIKAGLLQRFADATKVELRWLLTGEGPSRSAYSSNFSPLVLLAREVARADDELARQAERVLRAMLPEAHL